MYGGKQEGLVRGEACISKYAGARARTQSKEYTCSSAGIRQDEKNVFMIEHCIAGNNKISLGVLCFDGPTLVLVPLFAENRTLLLKKRFCFHHVLSQSTRVATVPTC